MSLMRVLVVENFAPFWESNRVFKIEVSYEVDRPSLALCLRRHLRDWPCLHGVGSTLLILEELLRFGRRC
jgi:hypothetical protein